MQKYRQLPGGSEAEDDKELDKLVRTLQYHTVDGSSQVYIVHSTMCM